MIMMGDKLDQWSAQREVVVLYQTRRVILFIDGDRQKKSEVKDELILSNKKQKPTQRETGSVGSQPQKRDCGKCGRSGGHDTGYSCPAARIKCNSCGVVGHFARVCRRVKAATPSIEQQQR
eukprot:GHVR01052334.1.p2 GENE.GHVR01052334.1~~GHVR01052334.1.p2  ORF type:complete len:121 (+),score=18.50 GHVR01052334.1:207-569(+)